MISTRRVRSLSVATALAAATASAQPATSPVIPDAEIRQILVERIDTQRQGVGMVVGVIDQAGRRIVAHGSLAKDDARPVDGNTIFEIGSITKVFTSLLLADGVEQKAVALTDPVKKYLPAEVRVPERGGRAITLLDLSTHTSGLARLPGNMTPKDASNPYADYSVDQLYQFLSGYQLPRDPGQQDQVLEPRRRVAGPRPRQARRDGLRSTGGFAHYRAARDEEHQHQPDPGDDDAPGRRAWPDAAAGGQLGLPLLAGAGALRSSVNDLLVFLNAVLGYSNSPLASAMAAMTVPRRPTGAPGLEIALGWHIAASNGKEIVWHNGGTGGYRSFIGYDPRAGVGVVVLSNAGNCRGPGRHRAPPARSAVAAPHGELAARGATQGAHGGNSRSEAVRRLRRPGSLRASSLLDGHP